MKIRGYYILVFLVLILVVFLTTGGIANKITGLAITSENLPFGYSPPYDVFNSNEQIFFIENQTAENTLMNFSVIVDHSGAYVYRYIYYWDLNTMDWISSRFDEIPTPNSDWIPESASVTLTNISVDLLEDTYFATLTCKKYNGVWKCGCRSETDCGYWMLQTPTGRIETEPLEVIPPAYGSDFQLFNKGIAVAKFNSTGGHVILNGTCKVSNECIAPDDSFVIKNPLGEVVSYIDSSGNLCLENGNCTDPDIPCDSSNVPFYTKGNENLATITIDETGELCYIGELVSGS